MIRRSPSSAWPASIPTPDRPSSSGRTCWPSRQAFRRLPAERLRGEDYFSADPRVRRPDLRDRGRGDRRLRVRSGAVPGRGRDLPHHRPRALAGPRRGRPRPRRTPASRTATGCPGETTGRLPRQHADRRVLPGRTCCGCAGPSCGGWSTRPSRPRAGRPSSGANSSPGWNATTSGPSRRSARTRWPGGSRTRSPGGSATTSTSKGGGYTVDGACASSLLAVAQACSALVAGDLDVALAGGVDLSLDPFELVGFAKAGRCAVEEMRVFDARSDGFWPGEGCGVVVLMRDHDALEQGRPIVAVMRGWGISSDGQGGITRPEVEGQLLALRRAYRRAGFGIDTVGYFEGHGTGTELGDATEIRTLIRARREAGATTPAGRDRVDQGQHRPHQGGRRRRRSDQGGDGRAAARCCRRRPAASGPTPSCSRSRWSCACSARANPGPAAGLSARASAPWASEGSMLTSSSIASPDGPP